MLIIDGGCAIWKILSGRITQVVWLTMIPDAIVRDVIEPWPQGLDSPHYVNTVVTVMHILRSKL
jgi:hypothetical protein